ncbi:MAG: signal peptidase I [Leptolyngbya sp. DLM2.Bin15]|nr:MAG: signal peptidase I [Leptolyngbya sp. DLM2.Bin15]
MTAQDSNSKVSPSGSDADLTPDELPTSTVTVDASDPAGADTSPDAQRPQEPRRDTLRTIVIAVALALLVRLFIAEPRFIPSDSMVPTLAVGDRLVIEKISYAFHEPQPGDIVVFVPPEALQAQGYEANQVFIKRLIAGPGQVVQVQDGQVWVDGVAIAEPYIAEPPNYVLNPLVVPPDQVFMLGDNRNYSFDSHVWGFLPRQNIIGRAIVRFWPFDRLGVIPRPPRVTLDDAPSSNAPSPADLAS